jgi:5-methylcytosine-specific restriction protein A
VTSKVCADCGRIIPVTTRGPRCPACQAARYAGSLIKPGRVNGWEWGRLRANVLRAQPWCVVCLAEGRETRAVRVDHRIRRVDGGTDAADNLQPLCESCHNAKHGGGTAARVEPFRRLEPQPPRAKTVSKRDPRGPNSARRQTMSDDPSRPSEPIPAVPLKPATPTPIPPVRQPVTGAGKEGYPDPTHANQLGQKPTGKAGA